MGTEGIGLDYYPANVGEWENSDRPEGKFCQGGNVWNEAAVSGNRGLRGGSFLNKVGNLHAGHRFFKNPSIKCSRLGFCVASIDGVIIPEPASAILLSLFGCLSLKRRPRR